MVEGTGASLAGDFVKGTEEYVEISCDVSERIVKCEDTIMASARNM